MKSDLFVDKKCIHVKVDTDVHAQYREMMFKRGLTMQDTIHEFMRLAVEGNARAIRIIEDLGMKKLKEQAADISKRQQNKYKGISELDHETLYDLIGGQQDDE